MPSMKKGISWLDLIIYGGIGCAGQFLEAAHLHMKPMERDANEKRHDNTQAARTELNWKCFNFGAKKMLFSQDFMNLPLLNKHKEMRGEIRMDWMDDKKKNQGSSCVMRSARDRATTRTHWGMHPPTHLLVSLHHPRSRYILCLERINTDFTNGPVVKSHLFKKDFKGYFYNPLSSDSVKTMWQLWKDLVMKLENKPVPLGSIELIQASFGPNSFKPIQTHCSHVLIFRAEPAPRYRHVQGWHLYQTWHNSLTLYAY